MIYIARRSCKRRSHFMTNVLFFYLVVSYCVFVLLYISSMLLNNKRRSQFMINVLWCRTVIYSARRSYARKVYIFSFLVRWSCRVFGEGGEVFDIKNTGSGSSPGPVFFACCFHGVIYGGFSCEKYNETHRKRSFKGGYAVPTDRVNRDIFHRSRFELLSGIYRPDW